jgi:hypothetical protein
MNIARGFASLMLISLVIVTTICAQACLEPARDSSCPVHSSDDCCKHDDSNAGRATLATLSHQRTEMGVIASTTPVAQLPEVDLPGWGNPSRSTPDFYSSFLKEPLSPSILHALRI